ncbi:MAG: hypothetical protein ACO1TE_29105 [Prosthecobacter sp.]
MADHETSFDINLRAQADTSAAKAEYDKLFEGFKTESAQALKSEGASPEFIAKFSAGLDEIRAKLDAAGNSGGLDQLNAEVEQLVAGLHQAAEAERQRIDQAKLGMQTALAEKDAQEAAYQAAQRRREEDRLAAEIEQMAAQQRIAAIMQEKELRESAARGRQMSAEQAIEREVMSRGAYSPAEEAARLRELDAGTRRVADAKRLLGANAGGAALEVGRLFEDMQYGIHGALNNLPGLITMLGGSLGLAGVVSIASVAVLQLWKYFDGAAEAAKKTEEAKESTDRLRRALDEAAEASRKVFEADLQKYLAGITAIGAAWESNKSHIAQAVEHQNALADAEMRAAQARLEIERQSKLGGASTAEEREAINADFDLRKATMTQEGRTEAMRRAIEAQALSEGTLKARIKDSEAEKAGAEDAVRARKNDIAEAMASPVAQLSDQARALRGLDAVQKEIRLLEARNKALLDKIENNPETGPMRDHEAGEQEDLQQRIADLYQKRDELAVEARNNRDKIAKGDVTFNEAGENFKEPSMQAAFADMRARLEQDRKAIEEITPKIKEADEQTLKLKLEARELEQRGVLLKRQQIALQEETKAEQAKAATDQLQREQKADEEQIKKDAEAAKQKAADAALAKENEARAEADPVKAAKLRNEAEALKLPPDATAAQRRKQELDAEERMREAREAIERGRDKQDGEARSIGKGIGAWANAAPDVRSGKGRGSRESANEAKLEAAAQKLEDGADVDELRGMREALDRLGPAIVGNSEARREEIQQLRKRLELLESQMKNGGRR